MKNQEKKLEPQVIDNIRKIMNDRDMRQNILCDVFGVSESQCSKILNCKCRLTIDMLSDFSSYVGLRPIDVITYPDVYELSDEASPHPEDPVEAVLQIRLTKDKKEQVMKLVFGDNNIEILNR